VNNKIFRPVALGASLLFGALAAADSTGPVTHDPQLDTRTRQDMTRDGNMLAECAGMYSYIAVLARKEGDPSAAKLHDGVAESYHQAAQLIRLMVLQALGDQCNASNACDPTPKIRSYVDEWMSGAMTKMASMAESNNVDAAKDWMNKCHSLQGQVGFLLQSYRDVTDLRKPATPAH